VSRCFVMMKRVIVLGAVFSSWPSTIDGIFGECWRSVEFCSELFVEAGRVCVCVLFVSRAGQTWSNDGASGVTGRYADGERMRSTWLRQEVGC
jgi:hypothetical protein